MTDCKGLFGKLFGHKYVNLFLFAWVVFTTQNRKEFEEKINSLPSYVMWAKETKIMQSGNWPNYTIVYLSK